MGHSCGIRRAYRNWTGGEEGENVLSKMVHIGEERPNSEPKLCKHSFTLRKKFKTKMSDRYKHIIIAKILFHLSLEKEKRCLRQGNSRGNGQEKKAWTNKPFQ